MLFQSARDGAGGGFAPGGLGGEEPRKRDLLGGSAGNCRPDAVFKMLPRREEGEREVGFVVAKNRAGPTDVEVVYPLVGRHFCFDPHALR